MYASDSPPPYPQWLHAQLLGSYAGCALQPLELSPAGDPPPLARVLAAAAAATTQGHAGASSGLVSTLAGAGMAPPGEHAQWMKWQLERYLRAQISHMEIKHAAALKAFCLADADDFALVRRFSPRGLAPADVNVFVQKMTHAAWAEGGAARGTAPSSVMEPDDGIGLESCRAVLGLVRYTYSLESVLVALRDAASELQQHVQAGQAKRCAFRCCSKTHYILPSLTPPLPSSPKGTRLVSRSLTSRATSQSSTRTRATTKGSSLVRRSRTCKTTATTQTMSAATSRPQAAATSTALPRPRPTRGRRRRCRRSSSIHAPSESCPSFPR